MALAANAPLAEGELRPLESTLNKAKISDVAIRLTKVDCSLSEEQNFNPLLTMLK
jgi:hypothetical protein